MVCKEDVLTWFQGLKSYKRIDVMSSLLSACLPFELRFLGTCLEDLGKRDFHDLRNPENGANNPSEISSLDIQCISDKRVRTKLAVYICLLRSCNFECANGLYKILANVEEVNNLLKSNLVLNLEDETLEELLLLYTLALNHPAFTFEQKLTLGSIFKLLQEEEHRLYITKRSRTFVGSTGLETLNDKLQMQQYQSCSSPEQGNIHLITNTNHCTPLSSAGDQLLSMPDQLNALNCLRYPVVTTPWTPLVLSTNDSQSSPLVSRTSSPCQSNSPSRAGSPGKPKPIPVLINFQRPPPRPENGDAVRETLGKEIPNYLANGQNCTVEQLRLMSDDELRDQGVIQQLRNICSKVQTTNGITNIIDVVKKKPDTVVSDSHEMPVLRRFGSNDGSSIATAPGLMYTVGPPPSVLCTGTPSCYTCLIGTRGPHNKVMPPQFIDQMKALRLDAEASLHNSNSSASDSASDHSPPDTPSLSIGTDRGPPPKDVGPGEMWNSIGGVGEEQQRIGDGIDDRRVGLQTHLPHGRARGLGRSSRSNPPGLQTVPRGRGANPTNRRRDIGSSNVVNGGPEERKIFSGNENPAPFPYSPSTASPYIPPHFMRSTNYPFVPGSFVRTTFPFAHPNGDLVYQFPPPPPPPQPFLQPSGPTPGPNPLPYSTMPAPPPKISCYNCGSQNHLPNECQDPTIEEVTKQGQYRIDYNPYTKSGECSSGNQDK